MRYPIIDDLAGSFIIDRGRLLAANSAAAADLFRPTDRTMFYEVVRVTRGILFGKTTWPGCADPSRRRLLYRQVFMKNVLI